MSELDLSKAIFDKIEELGPDAAAAFFGRTSATIKKWAGGTAQPDVSAAQKVLDEALASGTIEAPAFTKPPPQGETRPEEAPKHEEKPTSVGDAQPGEKPRAPEPEKAMQSAKRFSIVTPVNRDMSYAVVLSMLGNWKATLPQEIRAMLSTMDFEPDTLVHRARNILATRFLASGNEWSFWLDSDIVAPIGNPSWFKRRTGTKYADKWFSTAALERLTTRGKSLIGGVYAERNHGGKLINQIGLSPRDTTEKERAERIKANGPEDTVLPVGWLGFGCVAVHRRVFEDILKTQPEVKAANDGEPHHFFNAIEGGPQGEDVAFCKRAAQAGHPSFLDLSVFCGHVGKFAYMP